MSKKRDLKQAIERIFPAMPLGGGGISNLGVGTLSEASKPDRSIPPIFGFRTFPYPPRLCAEVVYKVEKML